MYTISYYLISWTIKIGVCTLQCNKYAPVYKRFKPKESEFTLFDLIAIIKCDDDVFVREREKVKNDRYTERLHSEYSANKCFR